MRLRRLLSLLLLALSVSTSAVAAGVGAETWVLVDIEARRMDVYRNGDAIHRFRNIAIGSSGAAPVRLAGQKQTPLGEFRINRINRNSQFHIFLGLDYPSMSHAERALAAGLIDHDTYKSYLDGYARLGRPPQDTPLGGYIGIHGIGKGDPRIHRLFDWT